MLLSSKLGLKTTAADVSNPRFTASTYIVSDFVILLGCLFFLRFESLLYAVCITVDCLLYDFAIDYCVERDQTEVGVHLHSILSRVSLHFFRLHSYSAAIMMATDLLPENAVRTKIPIIWCNCFCYFRCSFLPGSARGQLAKNSRR